MKCLKCKTKNINEAKYCYNCGNTFTEEERKKSKRFTLVWFLELKDKIDDAIGLSFIKNSKIVRSIIIVLILVLGISSYNKNREFSPLATDYYKIEYNVNNKEYYIKSEEEKVPLKLYSPKEIDKIKVVHYNEDNEEIESSIYALDEEIFLNITDKDYYIITGINNDKELRSIKVYFYYIK